MVAFLSNLKKLEQFMRWWNELHDRLEVIGPVEISEYDDQIFKQLQAVLQDPHAFALFVDALLVGPPPQTAKEEKELHDKVIHFTMLWVYLLGRGLLNGLSLPPLTVEQLPALFQLQMSWQELEAEKGRAILM